jgi:hypothetical protein
MMKNWLLTIVVADDGASNLIGNVALNTAHANGILTHKFIMPNEVDDARFRVSTSIDTAVVVPKTTESSQPKTSSLRALVESPRGHGDCLMPHISARHACVESSTPTDAPSSCLLVTQMLAKFPHGTVIHDFFTTNTVNLWGEVLCDQVFPDEISPTIAIRRCCNEKLRFTSDTRRPSDAVMDMERGWGATANMAVDMVFGWGAIDNVVSRWGAAVNMVVRFGAAAIRVMQRWEVIVTGTLSLFTCGGITVNRR